MVPRMTIRSIRTLSAFGQIHLYILNPRHADFPELQFSDSIPVHFDSRLIERR